jgi:hypothetical protein
MLLWKTVVIWNLYINIKTIVDGVICRSSHQLYIIMYSMSTHSYIRHWAIQVKAALIFPDLSQTQLTMILSEISCDILKYNILNIQSFGGIGLMKAVKQKLNRTCKIYLVLVLHLIGVYFIFGQITDNACHTFNK